MHEAYQVHHLIKLTHQVESIAANGNTLLVGTRQGHLIIYTLEEKESKCELTLMRTKLFSKKPIVQLEIIPEHDLLLSLSDNIVQLHDINGMNFNTLFVIEKSKGATYFAVHTEKVISTTGVPHSLIRLAVVVKRKIQLYFFKNNAFEPLCEDISLPDIPKSMVLSGNNICLGYRDEYALLKLGDTAGDNKQTELFPTSSAKAADPCILLISNTHFALCRETQTVLVNNKGETENKSLKWSEAPVFMAHDAPYTLGVLTDSIEVGCLDPNMTVQTLSDMAKVRFLVRSKQGILFAASVSQIWCLQMLDVSRQVERLLKAGEFQLALKLIQISDETEDEKRFRIHHIQTLLAYNLFAKKQFEASMQEFLKLETDPQDVIRLYPDMLPQQEDTTPTNKEWTDKDIQESINALSFYLTNMRTRVQSNTGGLKSGLSGQATKPASKQLLQIIDTILIKCYLQTNDAMVAPVIRLNYCHFAETEKILKSMNKYNDLIILYQTKGQHRKALELLKTEQSFEEDSVEKTIRYLQKLGYENMALILEFAEWVLKKDPEKGLKIFTEDLTEVESLPRPRILNTLMKEHPDLVIPYLEHVIHNWKDENSQFHNALIHYYREKVMSDPVGSEHIRKKLVAFLEQSTHYTAEHVLKDFPTTSLLEERALILGRLGKHEQAIALYVRALSDINKAKDYCSKVYEKRGTGSQTVYACLIKIILHPENYPLTLPGLTVSPKTAQPDLELALQLLEENATKVDPLDILSAFPDEVPVSRLHKFLSVALQKVLQNRRQEQLLKGLLYAEHLQCQEMKLKLQSKHVTVTEMHVCPVCKKRFGNQAALMWYPNGDVVHYACHKDK